MVYGFSTGSLALGDFRLGLQMVEGQETAAIELSALREEELEHLIEAVSVLNLQQFQYISVHAPSKFQVLKEEAIVELLEPVFSRQWPVVVHPDVIENFPVWRQFGEFVCIENMDKRKPIGRSAAELSLIFEQLPQASLCFDIAHAQQVDPTMLEAKKILQEHGGRVRQVHLSSVNSASRHERLSYPSLYGYRSIAPLIPRSVPVILETPVSVDELEVELNRAKSVFESVRATEIL